jgi:histidinol phosphatase-like PHP family hydrolase
MAVNNTPIYRQCDFHVHTRFSPCAKPEMEPAVILKVARELGIKRLGFTDHVFGFTDPDILKQMRRETPEAEGDLQVFYGCEADVLSVGRTTVTEDMLANLDYIMLSANHFNNEWVQLVAPPDSEDPRIVGKHYLEMFSYAATVQYADVIAHPFYVMPGTYMVESIYTLTESDLAPSIESLATNGIAVEISRRSITPEHIGFLRPFYRMCKQAGVKFSVGSDSHQLDQVGRVDVLDSLIKELELRDEDFWLPEKNRNGLAE